MFTFFFGLVVGSFLNVIICRMPAGKSVIFPPSHCPSCEHKLSGLDLVPVLSYLFLRGQCRYCGVKIRMRYPLVELITGLSFALAYHYFGLSLSFIRVITLMALLIPITFIDLDTMTIPDQLSLGGTAIAFVFSLIQTFTDFHSLIIPAQLSLGGKAVAIIFSLIEQPWMSSLLGALAGAGMIYSIYLLGLLIYKQETIGGGDVKLMLMIGMFLGVKLALLTMFLAMIAGSVIGVALIITKLKTRKDFIPFGPFIALGCCIAIFLHKELVLIYSALVLR